MVAACRAHEAELEDAFVCDPFAARLCGERGFAILRELPYANVMKIGMAISPGPEFRWTLVWEHLI